MTTQAPLDLHALAARVASELASRDQVMRSPSAAGARTEPAPAARSAPAGRVTAPPGVAYVRDNARIADFIDHTLLKAEATAAEIDKLCAEAVEHRFAAVCVNPAWVKRCAERVKGSSVAVCTVIGFPLGASASEAKAQESRIALKDGATELDMVAAIGHMKSGNWHHVADDIAAVVRAAEGTLVKVIIESAVLTPVEIVKACALAKEAGARYVKTSTGFHAAGGASAEAIALMRLVVGDSMGVKASGGVRDCAAALKMIGAGATRIGTSNGVAMSECLGRGPLPLRELLSGGHSPSCATGACAHEPAAVAGQPY
jgi:deoxyribose-phosphate aldolase